MIRAAALLNGYVREVRRDAPVGYWPLWDTGSQATDQGAGSANPGTYTGTTTQASGPFVSGPPGRLYGGGSTSFPTTFNSSQATVECWINPSAYPVSTSYFCLGLVNGAGSNTFDKIIGLSTSGQLQWYLYDGTASRIISSNVIPKNQWTHVAGTVGAAGMFLYVNGVISATFTATSSYASYTQNNVFVAGATALGGAPSSIYQFSGLSAVVAHAAIYNYALSPGRIAARYRAGKGLWMPARRVVLSSASTQLFTAAWAGSYPDIAQRQTYETTPY